VGAQPAAGSADAGGAPADERPGSSPGEAALEAPVGAAEEVDIIVPEGAVVAVVIAEPDAAPPSEAAGGAPADGRPGSLPGEAALEAHAGAAAEVDIVVPEGAEVAVVVAEPDAPPPPDALAGELPDHAEDAPAPAAPRVRPVRACQAAAAHVHSAILPSLGPCACGAFAGRLGWRRPR